MSIGDKPSIVARDAQQAVAAAKQATDIVDSIPGLPSKALILHILGGVTVAAGAVTAIATLGVGPGLAIAAGGVATYIIGWINPSPAAVSKFGASAK
jgi:small-conductance mechanosensitive channel